MDSMVAISEGDNSFLHPAILSLADTPRRCSDVGDRNRGEPSLRADGQSSEPFPLKVQCRPVGVSRWRVHDANAVPPLEHPRHRLLGDLLRLVRVTDQEDESLAERSVLGSEERLEVPSPRPSIDRKSHLMHVGP